MAERSDRLRLAVLKDGEGVAVEIGHQPLAIVHHGGVQHHLIHLGAQGKDSALPSLLQLAYYDDLSHSAIARTTELPLGTVKSRLRLAFARLRQALAEEA